MRICLALINLARNQRKLQFYCFYCSCHCGKLTKLSLQGMTGKGAAGKAGTMKGEDKEGWPYLISHSPVR